LNSREAVHDRPLVSGPGRITAGQRRLPAISVHNGTRRSTGFCDHSCDQPCGQSMLWGYGEFVSSLLLAPFNSGAPPIAGAGPALWPPPLGTGSLCLTPSRGRRALGELRGTAGRGQKVFTALADQQAEILQTLRRTEEALAGSWVQPLQSQSGTASASGRSSRADRSGTPPCDGRLSKARYGIVPPHVKRARESLAAPRPQSADAHAHLGDRARRHTPPQLFGH
jgi:hypothetical protein